MSLSIVSIPITLKQGAKKPAYAMEGDAGMDLHALLTENRVIDPGQRMLIPTGVLISIPKGYEGQIRPRSGLALKKGLTVLNSPGTIDSGYRGEIKIILINLGQEPIRIASGERIAQIVIAPVCHVQWTEDNNESMDKQPSRGGAGFGSSGI